MVELPRSSIGFPLYSLTECYWCSLDHISSSSKDNSEKGSSMFVSPASVFSSTYLPSNFMCSLSFDLFLCFIWLHIYSFFRWIHLCFSIYIFADCNMYCCFKSYTVSFHRVGDNEQTLVFDEFLISSSLRLFLLLWTAT